MVGGIRDTRQSGARYLSIIKKQLDSKKCYMRELKSAPPCLIFLYDSRASTNLDVSAHPTSGAFLRQINGLGGLERIALLQLLESLDGARLDADHVLPPVLGLEVAHAVRLVHPGVEHDGLVEVLS